MKKKIIAAVATVAAIWGLTVPGIAQPLSSPIKTDTLTPTRIVATGGNIENTAKLLKSYCGQVSTSEPDITLFKSAGQDKGWVLVDFGKEIQGGIQIVRSLTGSHKTARFRLCLGESVSEAMSDINQEGTTATNDHSVRDMEISLPWLGVAEYGNSGFRFARLQLIDGDSDDVGIVALRALSRYRDIPQAGSFSCSDDRLTKIWQTGAYTVHLCMQDYLWDGIKRDRLVWIGDMHPEVMAVGTVFGNQDVVRKSLDYVRSTTPPTTWMNSICSYSLWWIIIHHHLYEWYGDKTYLEAQHSYLAELLQHVMASIDKNKENYQDGRFIDWPSNDQPEVIHAGLQALTVRALEAGRDMARWLGDTSLEQQCDTKAKTMRTYVPDAVGNSQAAALLSLSGMMDAGEASKIIIGNGPSKFTSFMGYYLLEALARSGNYSEAMQLMSDYWGSMIDLGATTFWEDFNYNDGKKAGRIDEMPVAGKFDIHADGGAWCYVGLRHSFCHGWASGPTTWLTRHVLGIEPLEVGCRKIAVKPHLGNLEWAKGSFPTPFGMLTVSHKKNADGSVSSEIQAPEEVEIIL